VTQEAVLDVVVEIVERISDVPPAELRARADEGLVHDLGVDSIRMMRIWVEVEKRCGLEPGDLGFTQVATVNGLVEQVLA
jgi:acyl carrier protein